MLNFKYAGIGVKSTPNLILESFKTLGAELAKLDFTLRSGRAAGADSYFEIGAHKFNGKCEIYLPWDGFTGNDALKSYPAIVLPSSGPLYDAAFNSVMQYHPAPHRLKIGAMKLMMRNYFQVFGMDGVMSDFIICYTEDGKASGGTDQAIRMAEDNGVKVYNAHGYERNPNQFVIDTLNDIQKNMDIFYVD